MSDLSRAVYFADWNVDIDSTRYCELDRRYFDVFEHWLPLEILPKSMSIEVLEKEVDEAIESGIDLVGKYDTEEDGEPVDESKLERIY